jgi:hypothetical protein
MFNAVQRGGDFVWGAENFENDRTTKKQGLGQKAQQNAKKASKQKLPPWY